METIQIEGIVITYFGNSGFLLEAGGKNLYFDPVGVPEEVSSAKKADLILISHADLYNASSVDIKKIIKEKTGLFGSQKVEDIIGPDVHVIAEGDEIDHEGIQFAVVPAYNEGSSFHPRDFGYGYEVIFGGMKIYYAGDTDLIPGIHDRENIDIAFLPIEGETTMDYRDATEAVKTIKPKYTIPMHFSPDIDSPADNFRRTAESFTQVVVFHSTERRSK